MGKSSLINQLVNRKGLVKTSSTPGRTQLINFFLINGSLSLVDLPGYGYAKVPASVRAHWGPMVRTYLETRKNLKGVVLLQDLRRRPKDMDLDFMAWLGENELPCVLVATKADKVKQSVQAKSVKSLISALPPEAPRPILFSAVTGRGREELWPPWRSLSQPETQPRPCQLPWIRL